VFSLGIWSASSPGLDKIIDCFGWCFDFKVVRDGFGNNNDQSSPCEVPGMEMISCGYQHTTCVDENGSLWTFGENKCGELGLGDTEDRNKSSKVPGILNVKSLSKGCTANSCPM